MKLSGFVKDPNVRLHAKNQNFLKLGFREKWEKPGKRVEKPSKKSVKNRKMGFSAFKK